MPSHARFRRLLTAGIAPSLTARLLAARFVAALLLAALWPSAASADEPGAPTLPHLVLTTSVGVPLRLTQSDRFDQDRLAPAFSDVLAGYVFPSSSRFAHGVGLGFSLNLGDDGGFTEPVSTAQQFVLMPSYLLYGDVGADLFALGHAGIPIAMGAGTSVGFEIAAALGYRFLSGFGAYAETGVDLFGGASTTVHASLSLEVGVFLDYEVLQ